MAKQKHALERSDAIADAYDHTHALALELLDRLSILRLVYRAIDGVENILPNNQELSAARSRLHRLFGEINSLHNRADLLSGLLSRLMEMGATVRECVRPSAPDRELRGGASEVKARRLS
jgi:hypothetical protein